MQIIRDEEILQCLQLEIISVDMVLSACPDSNQTVGIFESGVRTNHVCTYFTVPSKCKLKQLEHDVLCTT